MRPLLVTLLVLVPLLAPAASASVATSSRADGEVTLQADGALLLVHQVTEGSGSYGSYSFPLPEGYAFVDARDGSGPLAASVEGDLVRVQTPNGRPGYVFRMTFEARADLNAPLVSLAVPLSAGDDDASSARARVPEGWRLVGWRASDGASLDEAGVVRHVGPMHAVFLAARESALPEAPDPRAVGERLVSDVWANVSLDAVEVTQRFAYDTDTYSPDWTFLLPENATFLGARTAFGPLEASVAGRDLSLEAPYPYGHHLGGQAVWLSWRDPAIETFGGGFRTAGIDLPARDDERVRVEIALADGLSLTGSAPGDNTTQAAPLVFASTGALYAQATFLPPVPEGETRFEEGAFVVQVPDAQAEAARAVARNATEQLAHASHFLGGSAVEGPFHVMYTSAEVFHDETGFYRFGTNAISIRLADLEGSTGARPRLDAVQTLVHEATHGLTDRLFAGSAVDLDLFDEGLARLAETHVERHFPDDVVVCETTRGGESCSLHTVRPQAEALETAYASDEWLPLLWGETPADAETTARHYTYSGFLFHAFEARAPPGTLARVLDAFAASADAWKDGSREARLEALFSIMEAESGLSRAEIVKPAAGLAGTDAFRPCLAFLAAPPYPWDTIPARDASCGAFWVSEANATAALAHAAPEPAAPEAPVEEAPPVANTTPLWTAPSVEPLELPPPPSDEEGPPSEGGDVPAGVFEPGEAPTPGFSVVVVVLGLVGVAWLRRR